MLFISPNKDIEIEADNKKAIKLLKQEGLYGIFICGLNDIPKDQSYVVMSDKNSERNLYCQYFREVDEFGQSGYMIVIIRNPSLHQQIVKNVEAKIIGNCKGIIHTF